MDGASHRGPQGPFLLANKLLAISLNFPKPLVIFILKNCNNLLSKLGWLICQQLLLAKNFIAAGMGDKIRNLKARNIICFILYFQFIAGQHLLKLLWFNIISSIFPETMK